MSYIATIFDEYDGTYVIHFNNLKKTDSGQITFTAKNIHGEDIKFFNICVLTPPCPLTGLCAKNITTHTAELYWMPSTENLNDIKYKDACVNHYIVEKKTAKHSRWRQIAIVRPSVDNEGKRIDLSNTVPLKYTTDELLSDEIYVFRVFAVNEVGKSDSSNTYDVVTLAYDTKFDDEFYHSMFMKQSKLFSTKILPLDTPSNIVVKNENNRVELSWNMVERAAIYGIERQKVNDDEKMWLEIANTDRIKFVDRSVLQTGKYIYRITAKLPGVTQSEKSNITEEVFVLAMRRHSASPSSRTEVEAVRDMKLYTRSSSGTLLLTNNEPLINTNFNLLTKIQETNNDEKSKPIKKMVKNAKTKMDKPPKPQPTIDG